MYTSAIFSAITILLLQFAAIKWSMELNEKTHIKPHEYFMSSWWHILIQCDQFKCEFREIRDKKFDRRFTAWEICT